MEDDQKRIAAIKINATMAGIFIRRRGGIFEVPWKKGVLKIAGIRSVRDYSLACQRINSLDE
jgi:hypothetical protein